MISTTKKDEGTAKKVKTFADVTTYSEIELALTQGREVQRCSIDQTYSASEWFTVNKLDKQWHPSRYRVETA